MANRTAGDERRGGRPSKGPRDKLSFRAPSRLRDLLERAADRSGRSVSEEVEYRVQRTFDDEDLAASVLGSVATARSAVSSRQALDRISMAQGHDWSGTVFYAALAALTLRQTTLASSGSLGAAHLLADDPAFQAYAWPIAVRLANHVTMFGSTGHSAGGEGYELPDLRPPADGPLARRIEELEEMEKAAKSAVESLVRVSD